MHASPTARRRDNPIPPVPLEKYRLDNGLTVILSEDHAAPMVAVDVNYHVGSKNERPGRTGFAHLFEHILFQGSQHFDDDFFKALQGIGGQINGGTSFDRTRYWEIVPSHYLSRALWLEADRMGWLLPALTQERMDNQVDVVKNERRQRYDNQPYGTVFERLLAVLFPVNHPYHWPTIGSLADLDAATLDDVREFFRAYYGPNNASVAIVGDFDPAEAKTLVQRYFGEIPPGPPVARLDRWVPEVGGVRRVVMQDRVQLPLVALAWPTVPEFHPDAAALDVFAEVLGAGRTGRLYRSLVYERQIAQDVFATNFSLQLAGMVLVQAMPRPGQDLEAFHDALDREIAATLAKGITEEDLDRVVAARKAAAVRSLEHIGGFGGRADRINEYEHLLGDPDRFHWDLQRYLDLTPAAVHETARRLFGSGRIEIHVEPMPEVAPAREGIATAQQRRTLPGPMRGPTAPHLPTPRHHRLEGGLSVLEVSHPRVPVVEMALVLPFGSAADPKGLPGVASMCGAMLDEGTERRDALGIAEELMARGCSLSIEVGADATIVSLSALRDTVWEGGGILADVVLHPTFPPDELERQRKRRLTKLLQERDSAETIARKTAMRALYAEHPYGSWGMGDEASLRAMGVEDVQGFYRRHFTPRGATLVVVGDLGEGEGRTLAEQLLGAWAANGAAPVRIPEPIPPRGRRIHLVDRPGAAQSEIALIQLGLPRAHPDYAVSRLMNQALGGFFSSRINRNLREDKGYTYGARSSFRYHRVAGPFYAAAPVDTKNTVAALRELVGEIEAAAGPRPFTREEIDFARGNLVASYGMGFETAGQITARLAALAVHDLPASELEDFVPSLERLTVPEVHAFARRALTPQDLILVVVGDAAAFAGDLEALAFGPVVRCDREGLPLAGGDGRDGAPAGEPGATPRREPGAA